MLSFIPFNNMLALGCMSNVVMVFVIVYILKKYMPKKRHHMYMNNVPKIARQSDKVYQLWQTLFLQHLKKQVWIHLIGIGLAFVVPPYYNQVSNSHQLWIVITVLTIIILLIIHLILAYFKALSELEKQL